MTLPRPSMCWKVDTCIRTLIPVFNIFCNAPFSILQDCSLSLNPKKLTAFIIIYATVGSCEVYYMWMNGVVGQENTDMFSILFSIRFSLLMIWVAGKLLNTILIAPKYLLKFNKLYQTFNLSFEPISFKRGRVILLLITNVALNVVETLMHLIFRYRRMTAEGDFLGSFLLTTVTWYISICCYAGDSLFVAAASLNKHSFDVIYQEIEDRLENGKLNLQRRHPTKPHSIQQIRLNFGYVCDMKKCLESAFGLHIFLNIVITFVDGIIMLFILIEGSIPSNLAIHYFFFMVFRCIILFVRVFITIYFSHGFKELIEDTGIAAHRLYNATWNIEEKEELMALSQEVVHRKGPLTAFHLFDVDYSLLPGIIGSGLTNIVILLQFRTPNKQTNLCSTT